MLSNTMSNTAYVPYTEDNIRDYIRSAEVANGWEGWEFDTYTITDFLNWYHCGEVCRLRNDFDETPEDFNKVIEQWGTAPELIAAAKEEAFNQLMRDLGEAE